MKRRPCFIGHDACVELRHPRPFRVSGAECEVEAFIVHFETQFHGDSRRNWKGRGHILGAPDVGQARHGPHVAAIDFVLRNIQIVELRGVVVVDQAGYLLEMLRFELSARLR